MKKPEERWEYRLIDGNWSAKAVAYCTYKHGYLTEPLMKVHKCRKRQCQRLKEGIKEDDGTISQQTK